MRYLEVALIGALAMVVIRRALEASATIDNPLIVIFFFVLVAASIFAGWNMPKITQYVKARASSKR